MSEGLSLAILLKLKPLIVMVDAMSFFVYVTYDKKSE